MNLYTDAKTDRMLLVGKVYGYVSEFKCRIYYTFATGVAGFWAKRKLKGKRLRRFKWPLVL
jgi:POT family proton-dependent oligopeptide transporter